MTYYTKQQARVNIAAALSAKGWRLYGFKENNSDWMTDYYDPADWSGIAEKNGVILVVDNATGRGAACPDYYSNSAETSAGNALNINYEKIEKLQRMTTENGCTEAEAEAARKQLEKIREKAGSSSNKTYFPAHQGNPKGSGWHIEKNGEIIAKGRAGLLKIGGLYSWVFNPEKIELNEDYQDREEHREEIQALRGLIEKIESAAAVKIGAGQEEKLQKVVEQVEKAGKELEKLENIERLEVGQVFYNNSGQAVQIMEIDPETAGGLVITVKIGKKSKGFKPSTSAAALETWNLSNLEKSAKNGLTKIYQIVEKTEVVEEIKYKKVSSKPKQAKQAEEAPKEAPKKAEQQPAQPEAEKSETEQAEKGIEAQPAGNASTLEKVIKELEKLQDINAEIVGAWIWISGDTFKHRETLKKLGFKWASKKKMWYFSETPGKKRKNGKEYSIDEIKEKYGSRTL